MNVAGEGRTDRRSMGAALIGAAAGAGLALLAAGQWWVRARATNQFGTVVHVSATGKDINAAVQALALVGLASVVAVLATRRVGRMIVGAVLGLAGLGTAVVSAMGAGDRSALRDAAEQAGDSGNLSAVAHSPWAWVALLGGVLMAAAGVVTVARGARWPSMSRKYDAPTGAAAAAAPRRAESPADVWKALDRGEDPTA